MPIFVSTILDFKDEDIKESDPQDAVPSPLPKSVLNGSVSGKEDDSVQKKKIESGKKLIRELKKLFARMAKGNKKYVDPSGVLHSIVDDFGQRVQIGEEKDIREFNEVLLARISDAFKAKHISKDLNADQGSDGSNPMQVDSEPVHDNVQTHTL